jgi:hypothetical protein
MSLTTSEMTPADLAAVTGNNGSNFGGDGSWWIIILFLFIFAGNWNNGGFFGNGSQGAADNYVLTSDFAQMERKLDGINNGLCDGFYAQAQLTNGVQASMANGFAQAELARTNGNTTLLQSINGIGTQLQQCCCDNRYDALVNANNTQNAINTGFCQTNYNNSNNTRDLLENQNANTRAILDALNTQQTDALKSKIAEQAQTISGLQLAASQAAQNQYIVSQLRPSPVPSFSVQPPYQFGSCNC